MKRRQSQAIVAKRPGHWRPNRAYWRWLGSQSAQASREGMRGLGEDEPRPSRVLSPPHSLPSILSSGFARTRATMMLSSSSSIYARTKTRPRRQHTAPLRSRRQRLPAFGGAGGAAGARSLRAAAALRPRRSGSIRGAPTARCSPKRAGLTSPLAQVAASSTSAAWPGE